MLMLKKITTVSPKCKLTRHPVFLLGDLEKFGKSKPGAHRKKHCLSWAGAFPVDLTFLKVFFFALLPPSSLPANFPL